LGDRKLALCLGSAAGVYDDVRALELVTGRRADSFDMIVAVNDIAARWPRITHMVSLHQEKLFRWQTDRRIAGLNDDYLTVALYFPTQRPLPRVDFKSGDWGGSSGLFAVKVALEFGATHAICCGIPMTRTAHFNKDKPWAEVDSYRDAWRRWFKHYAARTKSMSGYTRTLLGEPTDVWLASVPAACGK
jgi:hypothetical protein